MKEIAVNYSYHCRIFWNKFQRQKYKWQEHGCSTHMPGILNEQGLELDFQRCYQWLRTRTSFSIWSRSSPWERPSTSWLPHRTGQASTKPGTHERAENLPQSEKLSNFRCVHAFKNIKHQKRQNCGDSSEKWDWLDEVSCDKSRILWLPIFFSQLLSWIYHFVSFWYSRDITSTSQLRFFGWQKYGSFWGVKIVFCFQKPATIKNV